MNCLLRTYGGAWRDRGRPARLPAWLAASMGFVCAGQVCLAVDLAAGHGPSAVAAAQVESAPRDPKPGATDLKPAPAKAASLNVWLSSAMDTQSAQESIVVGAHVDFPAWRVQLRSVTPAAFINEWTTSSGEAAPDLAFIDNIGQLRPLLKGDAVLQDWGHDRFGLNGWWVIFRNRPHQEAARALLRWLALSPHWRPMPVRSDRLKPAEVKKINSITSQYVLALPTGKRSALDGLSDPELARGMEDGTLAGLALQSVEPLQTFGNGRLAFSVVKVVGGGERFYGVRFMAFILRNRGGAWRILWGNQDTTLDDAEQLFHDFDSRITADDAGANLPAPVLTEPVADAQLPLPASRHPELAWEIPAGAAASFFIEMQMGNPRAKGSGSETEYFTNSYLHYGKLAPDQAHYRIEAPFGVNAQPYRVRIWALNPAGQTALSDWHAMTFTNHP